MSQLTDYMVKQVRETAAVYVKDLQALSEEQLASNPGGCSRSAFDYTYELIFVNSRFADRLNGIQPPPWNREGWTKAPKDFNSKEVAIAQFQESMDRFAEAASKLTDEDMFTTEADSMKKMSGMDMCTMVSVHTTYHCGQLNLLQTIGGDAEMHWM